jgi:hypothetical protein
MGQLVYLWRIDKPTVDACCRWDGSKVVAGSASIEPAWARWGRVVTDSEVDDAATDIPFHGLVA